MIHTQNDINSAAASGKVRHGAHTTHPAQKSATNKRAPSADAATLQNALSDEDAAASGENSSKHVKAVSIMLSAIGKAKNNGGRVGESPSPYCSLKFPGT